MNLMTIDLSQFFGGLLTVVGFFIVSLVGIVAFFLRADRRHIADAIETSRRESQASRAEAMAAQEKLKEQIDRLERDVHAIKETLPERYVSRADWGEFKGWLSALFLRLEERLDAKQDRNNASG